MERFLSFIINIFLVVAVFFSVENCALSSGVDITEEFEIPGGAFSADFVRDLGNIAQIQFAGNYDKLDDDGNGNVAARAVVAQEFYKNHADQYDMLMVFTNFEFELGDAAAFNMGVSNKVKGINKVIYDNSSRFGSDSKLSSYIDMGNFLSWDMNPASDDYGLPITTGLHEIMHQWVRGVHVVYNNEVSDIFIGQEDSHWSALLDSDASVMYGQNWMEKKEGEFYAYDEGQRYSALDLYMAGFYSPEEVGVIHYIDSIDIDRTAIHQKGITVSGTELLFSIEDIVAAEGERVPNYLNSQKSFKIGLIYLTDNSDAPDSLTVAYLNKYAANLELRFAQYTGGRGFINIVNIARDEENDEKDYGETDLRSETDTELALYWLKSQQSGGYWQDTENTRIRDSASANRVLLDLSEDYSDEDYVDWAGLQTTVTNTDDAVCLSLTGYDEATAYVAEAKHNDNGWGLSANVLSSVFDTANVVGVNPDFADAGTLSFFARYQNDDGGWPRALTGVSDVKTTAMVVYALAQISSQRSALSLNESMVTSAYSWLLDKITNDAESIATENLAMILSALAVVSASESDLSGTVGDLISDRQSTDGSWEGSIYATSMVLDAIFSSDYANLEADFSEDFPLFVTVGEPLEFTTEVRNSGAVDAGAFEVSLYMDSVNSDNLVSTQEVGSLVSGASRELNWSYNAGAITGNQRAIIVLNSSSSVTEKTLTDNQIFKDYTVSSNNAGTDIGVYASGIQVSPQEFGSATENVAVLALVRNLSSEDCSAAQIYLMSGDSLPETVIAQQVVEVAAVSTVTVSFTVEMPYSEAIFIKVGCEGDENSSNDMAHVSLSISNTFDAELSALSVDSGSSITYGAEVDITVSLYNPGTQTLPTTGVLLQIEQDGKTVEKFTTSVSIDSGEGRDINFSWVPPGAGDYTIYAHVDVSNLVSETDETNNSLSQSLTVNLTEQANLNVLYSDISYDDEIDEGTTKEFDVLVRNTGTESSPATLAHLYQGKPFSDDNLLDQVVVPVIEAGETTMLNFFWSDIEGSGRSIIYVVLDPSDIVEEDNEEDNEAFVEVDITALSDLYITDSMVSMTPGVALPETDVVVSYDLVNVGGQGVDEFEVGIYIDNVLVETQTVTSLAAYASTKLNFTIAAGTVSNDVEIMIKLDSSSVIKESDEDNNLAEITLVAGDSNLYVSQRYISPNGDGVQDYTEVYLTVDEDLKVSEQLIVYDKDNQSVGEINTDMDTSFVWFGSVAGNRLPDGDYTIKLIDADGNSIAQQAVTIDTDSSSITEALGQKKKIEVFYEELFGEIAWLEPYADDSRIVFYVLESDDQVLSPGIYTADFTGGDISLIKLESSFLFDRRSLYNSSPYYKPVSLSANDASIIIHSYGRSDYRTDNVEIDLSSSTWNEWDSAALSKDYFYYDYYGVIYAVIDGAIYSVDPDQGEKTLLNSGVSGSGYDNFTVTKDDFVDKDTLVSENVLISFKDLDVRFYGDKDSGIVVSENKVAYVEGHKIVVENRDGSGKKSYDFYKKNKSTLNVLMSYSSFSPDETRLMLYFPDEVYYSSETTWNMGGTEGIDNYINSLSSYTDSENEPEPNGYRAELDLKTGNYTLKSNFNYFKSYRSKEIGTFYYSVFSDSDTLSSAMDKYTWNDYPVSFESCEGGVYLSNDTYLDRSFYPYGMPEEADSMGAMTPEFVPYGVEYRGQVGVSPFVTGFSFNATRILDGGFILFSDTEEYGGSLYKREDYITTFGCGYYASNLYGVYKFDSLFVNTLNDTAYLTVKYGSGNKGLVLYAIASDKNFKSYTIQYRKQGGTAWNTLIAPDEEEKYNEFITTWVPDEEGTYNLRIKTEDKAGNFNYYSTSVVWNESSNISNIKIDREVFSPNFDDIYDDLIISFKVLRTSNITMDVTSEGGAVVFEKTYSYEDVGATESITWDGTDLNGSIVGDGLYKISLDGYVYYTAVDTVFPIIVNKSEYSNGIVVSASATDENSIADFYYQYYGENGWRTISEDEIASTLDGQYLDYLSSNSFRAIAVDTAGNETVSDLLEKKFESFIVLEEVSGQDYPGDFELSDKSYTNSLNYNSPVLFQGYGGKVVLQYMNAADDLDLRIIDAGVLYAGNSDALDLTDSVSIEFTRDGSQIYISEEDITDAIGESGGFQRYYLFYIENDEKPVSDAFYYRNWNGDFSIELALNNISGRYYLTYKFSGETNTLYGDYDLVLQSPDSEDPYYSPVIIDTVTDDYFPTTFEIGSSGYLVSVSACSTYSLNFEFERYRNLAATFTVPCMPVELVPIADKQQCNVLGDYVSYQVCTVRPDDTDSDTYKAINQTASSVEKINAYIASDSNAGIHYILSDDVVFNEGTGCFTPALSLDKNIIPANNEYEITTEFLTNVNGDPFEKYTRKYILEDYFPVINITSPTNGGTVCATVNATGDIYLPITGSLLDYNSDDNVTYLKTNSSLDCSNQTGSERTGRCGNTGIMELVTNLADDSYRSIVQPNLAVLHGIYDGQEISGRKDIEYWALDNSGNLSCGSLSFDVDSTVDMSLTGIDTIALESNLYGISPNGDDVYDDLTFNFTLEEDVDISVSLQAEDGATYLIYSGGHVSGDKSVTVKGSDISLDDGVYRLLITATDGCGFNKTMSFNSILPNIEIDNTAPDIEISYPREDNELYAVTGVQVIAYDDNIKETGLYFKEKEAESWSKLKAVKEMNWSSAKDGTFYNLALTGLDDTYALRLYSVDKLGNKSETSVDLDLSSLGELLSYYTTDSEYFSPDSDGSLDSITGSVSVTRSADLTLEEGDEILAEYTGLPVGSSNWNIADGFATELADGTHNLVLTAQDLSGTEIGKISFIIDTIAPVISIDDDLDGRAGDFVASIDEENTDEITYILFDDSGSQLKLETMTQGFSDSTDISLNLREFDEGKYKVFISASDKAGHTTEHAYSFLYDVTAPVITLSDALSSDLYLNQSLDSLLAELTFVEKNPKSLIITLGDETLYRYDASEADDDSFSYEFDLSNYSDGNYALTFRMTDENGNSDEQAVNLTLDSISPVIDWGDNDFYIGSGEDFTFTITDATEVLGTVVIDSELEAKTSTLTPEVTWPTDLDDGTYTVVVRLTDAAGNEAEEEQDFIQDSEAPDAVVALKVDGIDTGADVSWTASSGDDVAGYILYRNDSQVANTESLTYVDTFSAEGTYTYYVKAYDNAGNLSDRSPKAEVTIDHTPPVIASLLPTDGGVLTGDVTFYATVTAEDIASVTSYLTLDDTNTVPLSSSAMDGSALRLGGWDSSAATGGVVLTVVAIDETGNTATATATYTLDNTPLAAPTGLFGEVTNGNTITLSWDAIDDTDLAGYQVWRSGESISGNISTTTYKQEDVDDGIYRYSIVSVDSAGNISDPSNAVEVTVDQHSPEITVTSPAEDELFENALSVVAVTDDEDVIFVLFELWSVDGEIVLSSEVSRAPYTASFDTELLDYANYALVVTATDANSNTSTQVISLEKSDLTSPEPATNVRLSVEDGYFIVTWDESPADDVWVYEVDIYDENDDYIDWNEAYPGDGVFKVTFDPLENEGDYYAVVFTYDENYNWSSSDRSDTRPYYLVSPIFPYSPTSEKSIEISVPSSFDGELVLQIDGSDDTTIGVGAANDAIFTLDPSVVSGELSIQGYYDSDQSTVMVPFLMEYGEKPTSVEIEIISEGRGDLTFDLASTLADGETWFYSLNGHLESDDSSYPYRGVSTSSGNESTVTYRSMSDDEWLSGIKYFWNPTSVYPELVSIDVWNGINWMRLPFSVEDGSTSNSAYGEFDHPVLGSNVRATFSWEYSGTVSTYIKPTLATIYTDNQEITLSDTEGLLSGIFAEGINLTATAISSDGVVGDESTAYIVEANSDEIMPEIVLTVVLDGEIPVLTWSSEAAYYSKFYIIHNDEAYEEVAADDSSSYTQKVVFEEGLNTYQIIGQTADGLMRASNEESVSLTYSDPDEASELMASFDETSWSVLLEWTAPEDSDSLVYHVYRKHLLQQSYELIATTEDVSYQDTTVLSSTLYQYYVVAVSLLGYPDHASSPTGVISVMTGEDTVAYQPSLLYPYEDSSTENESFTVRSDTVPETQLNLYVNDRVDSSSIPDADFSDTVEVLPYTLDIELGDKSAYVGYYGNVFDLITGDTLDWIGYSSGRVLYKGGDAAFVKPDFGMVTAYYKDGSTVEITNDIRDIDSDSSGSVLAFTTNKSAQIRIGRDWKTAVSIDYNEIFADGGVAVSPNGELVALMNGSYLWLVDISDSNNPVIRDITSGVSGMKYDIYWLNDERLMVEADESKIISISGTEIVSFSTIDGAEPRILGRYGNTLVVFYYLRGGSFVEGYSIRSGRRKYHVDIDDSADYYSYRGYSNFITAYGQLCAPSYPDTYCVDLPGVERTDLVISSGNNEVHAESVFEDSTLTTSSTVGIYRSLDDSANVELIADTTIRSLGRISDIALSIVHRAGEDVVVNGITAIVESPSGYAETQALLDDAVTLGADGGYDLNYHWKPEEIGDYTITIIMDADDEDASDNRVDLNFTVVEKGSPSLTLAFNEGDSVVVGLNTLSWSGAGMVVAAIDSPVNNGRVIVAQGDFDDYEQFSYTFSPGGDNVWLYDFTVEVELLDSEGNRVESSSISYNGDLVDSRVSTLGMAIDGDSVVQGEILAATYTVEVQTLTIFNGTVSISAVAEDGTVSRLEYISLWYLLDGETVKDSVAIDTSELDIGSYKIVAELLDSDGEIISVGDQSMDVTSPPVEYTGEISSFDSAITMNSECVVSVSVVGSVSNLSESFTVTLAVTGMDEITVTTMDSDELPFLSDVDISEACLSLGTKELVLSVKPEARTGQLLAQTELTVVDTIAPVIVVESPGDAQFINDSSVASVLAEDAESGIASVYLLVGTDDQLVMGSSGENHYVAGFSVLAEGAYDLQIQAYDKAGNYSTSDVLSVVMDTTVPVITIEGAANDGVYSEIVSISVSSEDTNSDALTITVNDEESDSTDITLSDDGSYEITAVATDKSGNASTRAISFVIDQTAPDISVSGVVDGALYSEVPDYNVEVVDDNIGNISVTLNGASVAQSGSITTDGDYTLAVTATDRAGNSTEASFEFSVDTMPPEVPEINITDGQQFDDAYVNVIGTGEAGTTFILELNGSETEIAITTDGFERSITLVDGANIIRYWAEDAAGNLSDVTEISVEAILLPAFDVTTDSVAEDRVLIWIAGYGNGHNYGNGHGHGHGHGHDYGNGNGHDHDSGFIIDTLKENGTYFSVVDNEDDLLQALRTHDFTVLLVSGPQSQFSDDDTVAEIRAMIAAGLGLLSVGDQHPLGNMVQQVCNVRRSYRDLSPESITIKDKRLGEYNLTVVNEAARMYTDSDVHHSGHYEFSGTCKDCRNRNPNGYNGAYPPVVDHFYGKGHVALTGFDLTRSEPQDDASDLLLDLIDMVAPTGIEGFSQQWGNLSIVTDADDIDGLEADIIFDPEITKIYISSEQINTADRIEFSMQLPYRVEFLADESSVLELGFIYKDASVLTTSIDFYNPYQNQDNNWQSLLEFYASIDVSWNRLLTYYRIRGKLHSLWDEDSSAIYKEDAESVREALVSVIELIKSNFSDDSEAFDEFAGPLLNVINNKAQLFEEKPRECSDGKNKRWNSSSYCEDSHNKSQR